MEICGLEKERKSIVCWQIKTGFLMAIIKAIMKTICAGQGNSLGDRAHA